MKYPTNKFIICSAALLMLFIIIAVATNSAASDLETARAMPANTNLFVLPQETNFDHSQLPPAFSAQSRRGDSTLKGQLFTSQIGGKASIATSDTLFTTAGKSITGGTIWQFFPPLVTDEFNPDAWSPSVIDVAPNYAQTQKVLLGSVASTSESHLFASNDGGLTWQDIMPPSLPLFDTVVFDDSDESGDTLIGLFRELGFENPQILVSRDFGRNWQPIPRPFDIAEPTKLVFPNKFNDTSAIYLPSAQSISRFDLTSNTWSAVAINKDDLSINDGNRIRAVAISPAFKQDQTIIATTDLGLYLSTNGGVNWQFVAGIEVRSVWFAPNYANVAGGNKTFFIDTRIQPVSQGRYGLFRTDNNGRDFTGLIADATDLEVSPNYAADGLIVAYQDRPIRSDDRGASWRFIGRKPIGNVGELLPSPQFEQDGTMLALGAGIWKSDSAGLLWQPLSLPATNSGVTWLADFSPTYAGDNTLWLLGLPLSSTDNGQLFRSTDGGATWNELPLSFTVNGFKRVDFHPSPNYATDQTLYISVNGLDGGFYRSQDAGQTWANLTTIGTESDIDSFAIAADGTTMFANLLFEGVFRSTDGGLNWQEVYQSFEPATAKITITDDFASSQTVFYGPNDVPADGPFVRSTDGGDTWIEVETGAPNGKFAFDYAVSAKYSLDQTILSRYDFELPQLSEDSGLTWQNFDTPLAETIVLSAPYYQGQLNPVMSIGNTLFVYKWPDTSVLYSCSQGVTLDGSIQTATLSMNASNGAAIPWRLLSIADWATASATSGITPQVIELTIDSSQIADPSVVEAAAVEFSLSQRQLPQRSANLLAPCYGISLPSLFGSP